jgi:hypothetical protein
MMKFMLRGDKPFWLFLAIWVIGAILTIAFWVAVILVAWHFIAKWW